MAGRSGSILGISPGTRTLGIAVIGDGILLDWGVRTFSGRYSAMKLRIIRAAVEQVIARYGVSHIAIKCTDVAQTSKGMENVAACIMLIAERKGISVTLYTLDQIKAFYAPETKIAKPALLELITKRYPMCSSEFRKEQQIAHRYYGKLFEAVAVADMYHANEL